MPGGLRPTARHEDEDARAARILHPFWGRFMDNDDETTQSFPAVEPPVPVPAAPVPAAPVPGERVERVREELPPGPPPPRPPPRFLIDDVWGWLALLLVVVVGGLLLWLLVLNHRGSSKPVVPAVVGLPQQTAIKQLTGDGYSVKAIVGPASRPNGIVVSQIPGGGSQLDKGATVTLHVSNGHKLGITTTPTTTTPAATTNAATTNAQAAGTAVPDVVGQDLTSGAGQIEASGLVAETQPLDSSSDPAGQIVQENPAAGAQAAAGSAVQLQVSTGTARPPVQVPNVTGQKAGGARAALGQAKLTVHTEYKKGAKKDIGTVISQSPAAGQSAPAYTQVTLSVGG